MPIVIGNINKTSGSGGGILTANNGLNLSTPTNVQLGGLLIEASTTIGLNGNVLFITGFSGVNSADATFTTSNSTLAAQSDIANFEVQINSSIAQLASRLLDGTALAVVQVVPTRVLTNVSTDVITDFGHIDVQVARTEIKNANGVDGNSTLTVFVDDIRMDVQDVTDSFEAFIDIIAGDVEIAANDNTLGLQKSITLDVTGGIGIQIADSKDNVGLIGASLFPVNGDPNQYLQAGNIPISKQSNDSSAETNSLPALVTFPVPVGDGMFLISGYTFFRSGIGSVDITVDYVDVIGNPVTQTISVVPCSAANQHTAYPSVLIKAQGGTNVNLNWVLTTSMTFDAGGVIEFLGS